MRRNELQPGYGDWLRFYRDRDGYTQRQLAEDAGVSYVTVNHLENGRRAASERVARLLADELEVRPEDLFPGDRLPTPNQIVERFLKRYGDGEP